MKPSTYLFLLAFFGSGCVHYMPAAVSSAPLGPKEHPVAMSTGESTAYYFLGLGPTGNDSLKAAVEDGLSQRKSDTMINVFIDRKILNFPFDFFPIFTKITTTVYGTLVRYDETTIDKDSSAQSIPHIKKPEPEDPERELLGGARKL